jgi:hypothetical protein
MSRKILWFSKKLDDCVVAEEKGDYQVKKVIDVELKALIKNYLQQTVCKMPIGKDFFPGSQPCSLMQEEMDQIFEEDVLFTEKTDGERCKFIALKLYSDVSFVPEPIDPAEEARKLAEKLNPIMPELRDQLISLVGNQKKYKTKSKRLQEEKERMAAEKQRMLQKQLMGYNLEEDGVVIPATTVEEIPVETKDAADEDAEGDAEAEEDDEEAGGTDLPFTTVLSNGRQTQRDEVQPVKKIKSVQECIALVGRSCDIYILNGVGVKECLFPLVMDGELTLHEPSQKHHFLIFGVDRVNGFPTQDGSEEDRVQLYHDVNQPKFLSIDTLRKPCFERFVSKPKFPPSRFDLVWKRYISGEYKIDGLIMDRNWKSVLFGTNRHCKKIKKAGKNSFDLRPRELPSEPGMLVLLMLGYMDRVTRKLRIPEHKETKKPMEFIESKQSIVDTFRGAVPADWNGKVYEFELDDKTGMYYALKSRETEKDVPNTAFTIQQTKRNIRENITPELIHKLWLERQEKKRLERRNQAPPTKDSIAERTAQLVHHNMALPKNFLKTVMTNSNWRPEIIPTKELANEIENLNFSWAASEQNEIKALNDLKTREIEVTVKELEAKHIQTAREKELEFEHMQSLLNSDGLKPISKIYRRKGRAKGTKNKKRKDKPAKLDKPKTSKKKAKTASKKAKSKKKKKKIEDDEEEDDGESSSDEAHKYGNADYDQGMEDEEEEEEEEEEAEEEDEIEAEDDDIDE